MNIANGNLQYFRHMNTHISKPLLSAFLSATGFVSVALIRDQVTAKCLPTSRCPFIFLNISTILVYIIFDAIHRPKVLVMIELKT